MENRPPRDVLAKLARMDIHNMAADVVELVDKALEAASVEEAILGITRRLKEPMELKTLKERATFYMALELLLSFAPDLREHLAAATDPERPESGQTH